jgi:hypothetical protein
VAERSMDEIRTIALQIYNAQDTSVLDYAADPGLRTAGQTPAAAYANDLLNPVASGLNLDEWSDVEMARLRQALTELAQADLEDASAG